MLRNVDNMDMAEILNIMTEDLPMAKELAKRFRTDDKDLYMMRKAVLENEDKDCVWLGFFNYLSLNCKNYLEVLDKATILCNEYEKYKRNDYELL